MTTFNELKIKEVIGLLRAIRGEMKVCSSYAIQGEQMEQFANLLNYPIQRLEGLNK